MTSVSKGEGQHICEQNGNNSGSLVSQQTTAKPGETCSTAEDANYWKMRHDKLLDDYTHLQKLNQTLEEKLLHVVETFEKKKEELVANIEFEKSTLMADVNKLSTKLVDARIKLHDYEEKELIHASECDAPCHKNCPNVSNTKTNGNAKEQAFVNYDPNLV